MISPNPEQDHLREATARLNAEVAKWPGDVDPPSGLTRADVDLIAAHVDLVVLLSGPDIPPLMLEPEDEVAVGSAFDHLRAFAAAWSPDRVGTASGLSSEDLDTIVATSGPAGPAPRDPDLPPEIVDKRRPLGGTFSAAPSDPAS